jgi:hypothetical protein
MTAPEPGIGKIKYFDKGSKRGVIAPENGISKQSALEDIYFQVTDDHIAANLRVGQLVQFIKEETDIGAEAKQISVLSEKA